MQIIDWAGLARGMLWVLGLSAALAAWSFAYWRARAGHLRLAEALDRPGFQTPFNGGLMLFACGLAWSASALWERLVWLALALAFAWLAAASAWPRLRKGQ